MPRKKSQTPHKTVDSASSNSSKTTRNKFSQKTSKHFKGTDSSGKEVWEVEKLLAQKIDQNGNKLYLVKWLGWPNSANTWEPRESFICDPETLVKDKNYKEIHSPIESDPDVTTIRIKLDKLNEISTNKSEHTGSTSSLEGSAKKKSKMKAQNVSPVKNQTDSFDSEEQMSEEWKKNEVRIAVQSSVSHNPQHQEVVIPSDLDTEFYMRTMESNISHRKGIGYPNSKSEFFGSKESSGFISGHRGGKLSWNEEDDEYLKIQTAEDSLMFQKEQQSGEFNFIKDSLYPTANEESMGSYPTKKVCKANKNEKYEYTIRGVDPNTRRLEITCVEKLTNRELLTNWFNFQQAAEICPNEAIDYLLQYSGFPVPSKLGSI